MLSRPFRTGLSPWLTFALVAASAVALPTAPRALALSVGDRPDLAFKLMNGQVVRGADLEGKLTVVEFWATWCPPCVEMVPKLRKMHREYEPKGVVLLSVSVDDSARTAQAFIRKHRMAWLQAHDDSQPSSLGSAWRVRGYPHAFLFAPDGELLWRGHPARLEPELDQALESHPPTAEASGAAGGVTQRDAMTMLREARKLLTEDPEFPDFAGAMLEASAVPAALTEDRRVQNAAERLIQQMDRLDPDGSGRTAAKANLPSEKAEAYDALFRAVMGDEASAGNASGADDDARERLAEAAKLRLAEAHALRDQGDHAAAYEAYLWITRQAADTPAGPPAAQAVTDYRADAAFMAELERQQTENKANAMLVMARNYLAADRPEAAKAECNRLIAAYPDSQAAADARRELLPKFD